MVAVNRSYAAISACLVALPLLGGMREVSARIDAGHHAAGLALSRAGVVTVRKGMPVPPPQLIDWSKVPAPTLYPMIAPETLAEFEAEDRAREEAFAASVAEFEHSLDLEQERIAAELAKAERQRLAKEADERRANLEKVASCDAQPGEIRYWPSRPGQPAAARLRSVQTTNPWCHFSTRKQVAQDYEPIIESERAWLASRKSDANAKLGVEPAVAAYPNSVQGSMKRTFVRMVASDPADLPPGLVDAVAGVRAAVAKGDLLGVIRIGSSYWNTIGPNYCIHDSMASVTDPKYKPQCAHYTGPSAWAGEYAMPITAVAERQGGDCRDNSANRWAILKMGGVPEDVMAIVEGGHGDGQHDSIVHVWNEFRVGGQLYVADYPSAYLDRSLVALKDAGWLANVGAVDATSEFAEAGFGSLGPLETASATVN